MMRPWAAGRFSSLAARLVTDNIPGSHAGKVVEGIQSALALALASQTVKTCSTALIGSIGLAAAAATAAGGISLTGFMVVVSVVKGVLVWVVH